MEVSTINSDKPADGKKNARVTSSEWMISSASTASRSPAFLNFEIVIGFTSSPRAAWGNVHSVSGGLRRVLDECFASPSWTM